MATTSGPAGGADVAKPCTCQVRWSYDDNCPVHGRAREEMGFAQCNHPRCGLAPNHPGDCKFGDNPRRDGDTIRLEPASGGHDNGNVYLSVNADGTGQVEIRKNDVQAFVNAVLEVFSRPPKCTRCGGSGKEPR